MIDRDAWQRLSGLLDEALALDPPAREAWLLALASRDADLAQRVGRALRQAQATAPAAGQFGRWLTPALEATQAPLDLAGLRLGAWRLDSQIGQGGMGEVWLARRADGLFEARAAIKLLRSDLSHRRLAARFARERAVLARLNHPAIARLLDAGVEPGLDGRAYLVLELVEGRTLVEHVRAQVPLLADRVRLLMQVAEAVDHAHAQLIVHRDLKPSNVLVTPAGAPKLLDFGIAGLLDDDSADAGELTRQTGRGMTLGYASPEQITGAPIGTGADVFALGVMLYELASGHLPYTDRDADRATAERAVLHDEPRALQAVSALVPDPLGPGRPTDSTRARGDLEAVIAKALRKSPADRYGSARAFIEDLRRWLSHLPVSVRRDDGRHRAALWLHRHALLAGSMVALLAALAGGLGLSTWQWRRAEQAARSSEQVTAYLTDMLTSASPDQHGGQWPTVLQLLDRSRAELDQRFKDTPAIHARMLGVMVETYLHLNRFDIAMPMAERHVALTTGLYGADDPRTLQARLKQAKVLQIQGLFDKSIALAEPLVAPLRALRGDDGEELREVLYILAACYSRVGRLEDADRVLTEAGRITDRLYPPGDFARLSHLNHVQVLRVGQGRLREALQALKQTEPYWGDTRPENVRQILVLRRNTIAVSVRLGLYEGLEPRTVALLADMDRVLGQGNDMAVGMRHEFARYHTETGRTDRALAVRRENLAYAQAGDVKHPALLLPLRAQVVLAQAQAHAGEPAALRREALVLLDAAREQADQIGSLRAEVVLAMARTGLVLDDAALAEQALDQLRQDHGLRLDTDRGLARRAMQLEGQSARLRGDLGTSRKLLAERLASFDGAAERQVMQGWLAALDLAWTLVLQGDPQAVAVLKDAASRRPPAAPAGHPLDAVAAYLAARASAGRDDAEPVRAALAELARQQGRSGPRSAQPGLASLQGAIF